MHVEQVTPWKSPSQAATVRGRGLYRGGENQLGLMDRAARKRNQSGSRGKLVRLTWGIDQASWGTGL